MEMLIKIYPDKPSRVGIKYQYDYLALRPYEDLVRKYPGHSFKLKIELTKAKSRLQFVLQSDQTGIKIPYKDIEYRTELLNKIRALMNSDMPIEFVHIYMEGNSSFIAKPFKKQTFFSISSIEIITPDNFSDVM